MARESNDDNVETIEVSEEDAAFVLGKGGFTKRKLARVSGARLELRDGGDRKGSSTLEIAGDPDSRARAKDYVRYVLTQRVGPVHIDPAMRRDDMSIVKVPEECVGFVMGRGGQVLRSIEDEWGTLMFFAKSSRELTDAAEASRDASERQREREERDGHQKTTSCGVRFGGEILAIFGTRRGRRGAELKVMSAVEHKNRGTFMDGERLREPFSQPGDAEGDGFDYDTFPFRGDEFSYALGSRGSTRKKVAAASGAIIEYVDRTAIIAGNDRERACAKEYLEWLMRQKGNKMTRVDISGRDDATSVMVPKQTMGYITGYKGEGLRGIEHDTRTFIFANGPAVAAEAAGAETNGDDEILIFGVGESDRRRAKKIIEDRVEQALRGDRRREDRDDRGRDDRRRDDRRRDSRDGDRRDDRRDDRRGQSPERGRYDDRRRSPSRYRDRSPEDRRRRSPVRYRGRSRDDPRRAGDRSGDKPVCFDWSKGMCRRDRCKFAHEGTVHRGDRNEGRDRSRDRSRDRDRR
jgi:hypothetical protein